MRGRDSCEDKNTIESQVTGSREAPMAAFRKGMVCRMYDVDNWELVEGGHPYVMKENIAIMDRLTLCLGFVAFDQYKSMLQDADGKISGPRTVIAGFGAGVTESLLAVTPFESIKTTL